MNEECVRKRGEGVFGIYLPQPLNARLIARVGIDGKNRNAVVRKAIAFYLEACKQQENPPAA